MGGTDDIRWVRLVAQGFCGARETRTVPTNPPSQWMKHTALIEAKNQVPELVTLVPERVRV